MNIILTSALSGIIFMFSGFVLKDKKKQSILATLLFVVMILSAFFQLNGQEILAGKYENMIVTDTYRVFFFIALCLFGIYYVLVYRKVFYKLGSLILCYFFFIFVSIYFILL